MKSMWTQQKGIALAEVVVAFIVMGVILFIATGLIHTNSQSYARLYFRSLLMAEARKASRTLRNDIQALNPNRLTVMKENQLKFQNLNGETVEYKLVGNSLLRNGQTVATHVKSAKIFSYLDKDKKETAVASEVFFIQYQFQFEVNEYSFDAGELVYARNKF